MTSGVSSGTNNAMTNSKQGKVKVLPEGGAGVRDCAEAKEGHN